MDSTVLEIFCSMLALHFSYRLVSCTFILQTCHVPKGAGYWAGHWNTLNWFSWSSKQFKTTCVKSIMMEVAIIRWVTCGHRGLHINNNNKRYVVVFKQIPIWFLGTQCVPGKLPTPLHQQQTELLRQGSWFQRFIYSRLRPYHLHVVAKISVHQSRGYFYSFPLFGFIKLV